MRLSDFDFELPEHLIAQTPADARDGSRLLLVPPDENPLEHLRFGALPGLLAPGDLLVVNDARVVPARLLGHKEGTGGRVELLLIRPADDRSMAAALGAPLEAHDWRCLGQASKGLRVGQRCLLGAGLQAEVREVLSGGELRVHFSLVPGAQAVGSLGEALEAAGRLPLPPYITRDPVGADAERYQTIYGRVPGAIAAPTAGLHFTENLLAEIALRDVRRAHVTLEVGPGTFMPVRTDDVREHAMHSERYFVPEETAQAIADTRKRGGRVVAVGTTVVRTLESATDPASGALRTGWGDSVLFLRPGSTFRQVDALVTNFHLPKSTLFMLVCAALGTPRARAAYAEAVARSYRFFSYGDAMFIPRIPR